MKLEDTEESFETEGSDLGKRSKACTKLIAHHCGKIVQADAWDIGKRPQLAYAA
jgi:hypothetical protein